MPSQDCARSAQDSAALERYLISPSRITKLKKIGRGGCGVVYSGTYAKDDRDPPVSVALKVLNVDTEVTGQTLLPFDNEVRMLERASSQCEHVCRFYGISSLEDQPCIVMKLYSRTLAAELEAASDHKLALRLLIRRGIDICRGLQELHAMGIAFRDLKPPNVLVGENGTAVLADFGIAKAFTTGFKSSTRNNGGTFEYMAPECFDEARQVSSQADIWALGCTLLEMCAGPPFPLGTPTAVVVKRIVSEGKGPEVPPEVPEPLAGIIRQCLQPDPQKRPTVSQVQQELEGDAVASCSGAMAHVTTAWVSQNQDKAPMSGIRTVDEDAGKQAWRLQMDAVSQAQNWHLLAQHIDAAITSQNGLLTKTMKQQICFAAIYSTTSSLKEDQKTELARVMVSKLPLILRLMSQNCDNPGALAWVFYDICRFGSPKGRHWYTPGYTGSNKENWTALATVLSAITEVLQHEVQQPDLREVDGQADANQDNERSRAVHSLRGILTSVQYLLFYDAGTNMHHFADAGGVQALLKCCEAYVVSVRAMAMRALLAWLKFSTIPTVLHELDVLKAEVLVRRIAADQDESDENQQLANQLVTCLGQISINLSKASESDAKRETENIHKDDAGPVKPVPVGPLAKFLGKLHASVS